MHHLSSLPLSPDHHPEGATTPCRSACTLFSHEYSQPPILVFNIRTNGAPTQTLFSPATLCARCKPHGKDFCDVSSVPFHSQNQMSGPCSLSGFLPSKLPYMVLLGLFPFLGMAATSPCSETSFMSLRALIPWTHSSCVAMCFLCRPWFDKGSHRTSNISITWTCLHASVWTFLRSTNAETLKVISRNRVISSCQAILMAEMFGNM